jgi:hypothetical protein
MGASPIHQLQRGQSPVTQPNAPGPTLLGLLSLLPPQFRWTYKTYWGYPVNFLPLVASTTDQRQITIDSQSHFIQTYACCIVTDTTDLIQVAFIPQLVQVSDSGSQSTFWLTPPHAMAFYGDASQPGVMAIPYIFAPAVTVTIQHQNLQATNSNVRVLFSGMKSYPGTDTREKKWQQQ